MSWRGSLGHAEKGLEEHAEEPAPLGMHSGDNLVSYSSWNSKFWSKNRELEQP